MIMKNFKFKPIFPLATNAKTIDVKAFDLSPPIVVSTLEPFATTSISKPFVATSTSKPLIVTFASKLASKLVNQVCHTSTTKKKKRDCEGTRQFQDKWVVHLPWANLQ